MVSPARILLALFACGRAVELGKYVPRPTAAAMLQDVAQEFCFCTARRPGRVDICPVPSECATLVLHDKFNGTLDMAGGTCAFGGGSAAACERVRYTRLDETCVFRRGGKVYRTSYDNRRRETKEVEDSVGRVWNGKIKFQEDTMLYTVPDPVTPPTPPESPNPLLGPFFR